ncbi:MAG: hypothetical protein JRN44_01870 [Nitrososphaerota archaeon]|jgi:hypothetical protein|nr:hypothetical protein [Nitrososphaerota archaeon]MDG6947252.1 hypothetical protein [Nitrososphaerota archaeon]MDG6955315.1 hypothetical protein [Nitrososphaerota archaeon]
MNVGRGEKLRDVSPAEDADKKLVSSSVNDVLRPPAKNADERSMRVRQRAAEFWDENYIVRHDPAARA